MSVGKLELDHAEVKKARRLARTVGKPIVRLAKQHTTVSVERATLRLAGLSGADAEGTPWVNRLFDAVRADVGLEHGIALPVWHALRAGAASDLTSLAQQAASGSVRFELPEGKEATRAATESRKAVHKGLSRIDAQRRERERLIARIGDAPRKPWSRSPWPPACPAPADAVTPRGAPARPARCAGAGHTSRWPGPP